MAQGTLIRACSCDHKAQDAKYGKGMRVFNSLGAKKKGSYRCTVCKAEKRMD